MKSNNIISGLISKTGDGCISLVEHGMQTADACQCKRSWVQSPLGTWETFLKFDHVQIGYNLLYVVQKKNKKKKTYLVIP